MIEKRRANRLKVGDEIVLRNHRITITKIVEFDHRLVILGNNLETGGEWDGGVYKDQLVYMDRPRREVNGE